MLSNILDLLQSIGDFFASIGEFAASLIEDIVLISKFLGLLLTEFIEWNSLFGFLPPFIVGIVSFGFFTVVLLRIIGRD